MLLNMGQLLSIPFLIVGLYFIGKTFFQLGLVVNNDEFHFANLNALEHTRFFNSST
jgi:uncharacterized membrane-anchored protein YitT (DUF2179 family)